MLLRLATHAMGTRFELVLVAEGSALDATNLRAAGEEALAEIEECDRRLSLFARDSLLGHVNRTCATRAVRLDRDTYRMLELCDEVWRASRGAFDPTIAPLMEARGFRAPEARPRGVDAALARVGWDAVELDRGRATIRFRRPGLALDLGGVAKGHGLDLAARCLREAGVERALLHGGTSTVVAIGAPPGADGWRVAVSSWTRAPVALLADACLSVSAPNGRTVEQAGEVFGHVLDPRSGSSAHGLACAAVIAGRAALADAWSTALLVAGPELAPRADVEILYDAGLPGAPSWRHAAPDAARFLLAPPDSPSPDSPPIEVTA